MVALPFQWYEDNSTPCPDLWVRAVQQAMPGPRQQPPLRAAQLLWQRQLCQLDELPGFLHPSAYRPTPGSAFGAEMEGAVERLKAALAHGEKVAIWGDFDADGVTSTAVLWDGLGQLFPKQERLTYYIPNRITESHGLSYSGLDQLKTWGAELIVTCDTGSTHAAEIDYASSLGMDVIVTDHHTLPDERPNVVALINPRNLEPEHPLATLSGVAVAYKLLESFYAALEVPPPLPLEHLLDLVAIGLIADLVELRGDCRYLAQRGLQRLQSHLQPDSPSPRPGVAELLTLCKRTGDRPTDISFGLGPRINAVSRIHGDASFCVELLTSQDPAHCRTLAYDAELANTRRKGLQREVYDQVMQQVAQIDLATTQVLVLADEQWPAGILGLVAGQVSQQLGRPTVLLRIDPPTANGEPRLARGSARSVPGLDLYELFKAQAAMLTGFGGHPLAAGLALPVENISILTAALNQAVREKLGGQAITQPKLTIDLTVTVADLGQDLFRELKLLEPFGMGNPVPKLLIRNAWFQRAYNKNLRDQKGQQVKFIKTNFEVWDDTTQMGFPGEWWGHYKDELPPGRCDVVVELDHNRYSNYHVKLVDVRPGATIPDTAFRPPQLEILDWRHTAPDITEGALILNQVPLQWSDWQTWQQQATEAGTPLAVAFSEPKSPPAPLEIWRQLVGLAKYVSRTQMAISPQDLMERLGLSPRSITLALDALQASGFDFKPPAALTETFYINSGQNEPSLAVSAVRHFLEAVQEEQFRRNYFSRVPLNTLMTVGSRAPD
jgi:single-stranded-DNA-specific exonuclease